MRTARSGGTVVDDEICVVTHPLSAAGENATRSLLEILSTLTAVSLITADLPADSKIRDRYEVIEITRKSAGENVLVAAVRFVVNQIRMAVAVTRREEGSILFFGATAYLLPMVVAKAAGKTVIVEPRGDVPLSLRLAWERRLPPVLAGVLAGSVGLLERGGFRLADAIITYTPGMACQLDLEPFEEKLHTDGARYVDTDRFKPAVPFDERENRVGYVGRLDEEKGTETLARVVRHLSPQVTFRFVGDGALREWLETELADELESGAVEQAGWVDHDEVPVELNRLRLLVLPSSPTEGLPTIVLESLACGTPVYATPVSGVPDVVRDGETGFLMNESEPDRIAQVIDEILARDDLGEISLSGRELIESEFSFDAAVTRYRTIFEAIGKT